MKNKLKVYIRGVHNRGKEVIKILEDYGASNSCGYVGDYDAALYFINHEGIIDCTRDHDAEFEKIIIDNYNEITLQVKWKDGDILFSENNEFAVYKDESIFSDRALAYIVTCYDSYLTDKSICKKDFRLATKSEITQFYNYLHSIGKDWDPEKKQLMNLKWKPKFDETYWIVTTTLDVNFFIWKDGPTDIQMFDAGNCFKTKEKAYAAAKKIRNLLKGE